jgi:membrane peptidoglycan carboxypeptidase
MRDRLALWWYRARDLPWGRIALGTAVALAVIVAVPPLRRTANYTASKAILLVISPFAPDISGFEDLPRATKVLAADGTEVGRLGDEDRQPVRLQNLPPYVPSAVLAAEDAGFYHHGGVDFVAVGRATFNDVRGRKVQGGSTITQQLAKLNYAGSQHTVFRKLREVLYASRLEQRYSKRQLLERYLNQVYLGNGNYGIAAAAANYFGVNPDQLTPAQAATLAGMIHSPAHLIPYRNPQAVIARRNQVLRSMQSHGWLSETAARQAQAAPLTAVPEKPGGGAGMLAPHFVGYVQREASGLDVLGGSSASRGKQLYTGGYVIETTLDRKALDAATQAVQQTLGAPGDPTTAVASVQPGDGAVRVLFGGLDANQQFDVADQGKRQPGSSFKPYLYLAALESGIDPRSQLDSGSPKTVPCQGAPWTVKNFEGTGSGQMTIDQAMSKSVNTVFQQLMGDVGPAPMQHMVEKLGIAPEDVTPGRCAMALGGIPRGVSPLEQAAAFATFAAKGVYAEPYGVVRIKNRHGQVVYEHTPKTNAALVDKEAGVLNASLEGVVNDGTGTSAAIGRAVAGKTGTTENFADAWFIGYVPQLATAVWVGHPEALVPMTDVHGIAVTGGTYPARVFSKYMKAVLNGVPVQALYTASPDELPLHLLNATTTTSSSTTTSTSSSTTSTTVPDINGEPPPEPLPPDPGPPPPGPSGQPSPRPRSTSTTTQPRPTTSTSAKPNNQKGQDQGSPTTLGP